MRDLSSQWSLFLPFGGDRSMTALPKGTVDGRREDTTEEVLLGSGAVGFCRFECNDRA